jgi:glyoxylase-like metal-dependent hydrolase (beta-lactamase superfamily II)
VKIHVLPSGPIQTVGYLLTDEKSGEAVLIDAPGGIMAKVQPVLEKEKCKLTELWLTHGHWDHMQDAADVKQKTGALVRAHQDDQGLIETPEIMEGFMGQKMGLVGAKIDAFFQQGERLTALGREFEVRHVPGHCPGSLCFHLRKDKLLVGGDVLFAGGVGRWDLPGGDGDLLFRGIREKLYPLGDDVIVLPGHGPATTIGEERAENKYVQERREA